MKEENQRNYNDWRRIWWFFS